MSTKTASQREEFCRPLSDFKKKTLFFNLQSITSLLKIVNYTTTTTVCNLVFQFVCLFVSIRFLDCAVQHIIFDAVECCIL